MTPLRKNESSTSALNNYLPQKIVNNFFENHSANQAKPHKSSQRMSHEYEKIK